MIVEIDEKAKKYIKNKNINNIVLDIDMDSKAACCGAGSIDFVVFTNAKDKVKNYKLIKEDKLDIYYSPNLEFYFKENDKLYISSFGISKFQKLYITNEINILSN